MTTILLIDDDAPARSTIARILRSAGYEVVEAEGGHAGLAALGLRSPDLVITDIIMPDQEGIETIARIREVSAVPIIAISGAVTTDDFDPLRDAKMIGANVTLGKPIKRRALLAAVSALIGD